MGSEQRKLNDAELELARRCYGYGRWKAPYWFIGLEEGQALREKNDFTDRAQVFRKLNKDGLCDCLRFHKEIGENRWHEQNPRTGKVNKQSTWQYLILLLMAFQQRDIDNERRRDDLLRAYQSNHWGMKGDETCVIELSGLPAHDSKASFQRPVDMLEELQSIRPTRIERIQANIREYHPRFVVLYGLTAKEHWKQIVGFILEASIPRKIGLTTFLLVPHPTARHTEDQKKDDFWINLGTKLRAESNS
jgi:hypothetical protein